MNGSGTQSIFEAFPGAEIVAIKEEGQTRAQRAPYALRKRLKRDAHLRFDARSKPIGGLKSVSPRSSHDIIWGDHLILDSVAAYNAEADYALRLSERSDESEGAEAEAQA